MAKGRVALPRSVWWVVARIVAGVLAAAVVVWVLFIPVADWLVHHDVGPVKGSLHETAVDNARGQLLTLRAGLVATGALVFTALNFNLLRRNSERADQWQQRTHELTEQGQVTDRYTKAIEQLGSDKLDVRIGGIYALERVARDSGRDHPTVVEVLAAFIREHSRELRPQPETDNDNDEDLGRLIRPDVQAAVTVLGRRERKFDVRRIALSGANLSRADLGGEVPRTVFRAGAVLGADFRDADLSGADLSGAILAQTDLVGADLTRACLIGADLTGAGLDRAVLNSADLTGAVLTNARYARADFTAAMWPEDAEIPEGWERDAGSGRLHRTNTAAASAQTAQTSDGTNQNAGLSEKLPGPLPAHGSGSRPPSPELPRVVAGSSYSSAPSAARNSPAAARSRVRGDVGRGWRPTSGRARDQAGREELGAAPGAALEVP